MVRKSALAVSVAWGMSFCPVMIQTDARAAEVNLLSAAVMKPALGELCGEFERASGHKVPIRYDLAGAVRKRIIADEIVDLAITQRPVVEALIQQGKIRQDSMVTLARSGVGVGVSKGTVKPDVSSVEALKRTLMAAKSFPIQTHQ